MVRLALHSIAYEAKTLNLAKEGFTAFYVDDATGSDAHDGGSWGQAFKTIQHAIDEAESWAKIFVKSGTYVENVVIDKQYTKVIGEHRDTTIIQPTSGIAITIGAENCSIERLKVLSPTAYVYTIQCNGDYSTINDVNCDGVFNAAGIEVFSNMSVVKNVYMSNANALFGIICKSATYGNEIYNNQLNLTSGVPYAIGMEAAAANYSIHDNTIENAGFGIHASAGTSGNRIFHNNLINNGSQIADNGTNIWFENYYNNHTTDNNHDGITDALYTQGGATDYQPVSHRNGWKRTSLRRVVSASGSNTLNDANPSDTIIPLSLPTNMHTVLDISNLNNNLDDFTLEVKVGAAASERVVAYYKLTSDGSDITIDTGSGVGAVLKQRKIDISNILVYTGEQVLLNYTKNGATDRDVTYKYVCGG